MKYNYYIILFLSVIFSCENKNICKKKSLIKSDKAWFDTYTEGDTIVFKSNKNLDTFIVVTAGTFYSDCNRFEFGEVQYNQGIVSMRQFKDGKLRMLGDKIQLEFSNQTKLENSKLSNKNFLVFDLKVELIDLKEIKRDTIIFKKTKESVYRFSSNDKFSKDFDGSSFEIKSFHWSKEFGLLRYETKEGETFERLPK